MFTATAAQVDDRVITPAECVLYSTEQYARSGFPFQPWDPGARITWVRGRSLGGADPVALPAGAVYLSAAMPLAQDVLAQSTSNGLAAGATLEAAVLGGMCEVIERDAVMITWMNRLPAAEIDVAAAGGFSAALHRHYRALGMRVRCFALATDLPATVVLALGFDDSPHRPATVAAAGCHPAPAMALEKAMFELCQARPAETARFRDKPPADRLRDYADVATLDDHSAFVALPAQRAEFEFLWSDGRVVDIFDLDDHSGPDAASTLEACGGTLADLGHPGAYAELTTPDVAAHGYHVVRFIAAGLQPIHFGHGRERLGGDRLFDLPRRLGLRPDRAAVADLNPCPHPMA